MNLPQLPRTSLLALVPFVLATAACGGGDDDGAANPEPALSLGNPVHVTPGSATAGADGTEEKPFATIYDALDAIEKDTDWDGKVMLHGGRYELPSDDPQAELADRERILPSVQVGEPLAVRELTAKDHTTQPPARFSEASLTAALEECGPEAERVECPDGVGGQVHSGARVMPACRALDDVALDALLSQGPCGPQTGDPATDNEHAFRLIHQLTPETRVPASYAESTRRRSR